VIYAGQQPQHCRSVNVVLQRPGSVPHLSARENVMLGLGLRRLSAAGERADEALGAVGLTELRSRRAATLSAGERQRVALARALAADVSLLLADEPTARLDEENARAVGDLLARAARGSRGRLRDARRGVDRPRRRTPTP
jgi:ABC-type lipoprotein export system ATPase subunit